MITKGTQAIQSTFHRRSAMIGESISYMIQQISFYLQRAFFPIKVKLQQSNSYSEQRLDLLAAANLAMQMLNGCATPERRLLLRLSMHILFQMVSGFCCNGAINFWTSITMVFNTCSRLLFASPR